MNFKKYEKIANFYEFYNINLRILELWFYSFIFFQLVHQIRKTPICFVQAAAIGNGEVVEYLLQNGVKGRVADSLGITPVSEARRRGHTSIISLFERRNSLVGLN